MLGGATPEQQAALRDYGFNLGIAFQLVDDLLDFTGDEAALGKPVGGDLREGKVTLPVIHLLRRRAGRARVDRPASSRDARGRRPSSGGRCPRRAGASTGRGRVRDARGPPSTPSAAAPAASSVFPPGPERDALMALPDYVLARDR